MKKQRIKSAKDIAFDKERADFRKQIREKEIQIKSLQNTIQELHKIIKEKEKIIEENEEICQKNNDLIKRLLEYADMSKEDLRILIDKGKQELEFSDTLNSVITSFMNCFGFMK